MLICTVCRKEMLCIKTSRPAVWTNNHVYYGTEYECPACEHTILQCAKTAVHIPDALVALSNENPVDMKVQATRGFDESYSN